MATVASSGKSNRPRGKHWSETASLDDALSHGLTQKEFENIRTLLGRELNMVELGICGALYSEHCSYKSTKVHLRNLPSEGPRVVQGPGENAGVIDVGDGDVVVFKVESHNHPTFIEPYQGAATGVGGILRDVFTMGARPVALMNALRFGEVTNSRTPYLLSHAVAGIGGYGNCVGIPTVGGELFFDESFNGNCLVNAFALGLAKRDGIFLANASGVGNPVIYFGSKTGRDGIRGANMASEAFDESSAEKRPTVQVGDPFSEKLLIEASLEVMRSGAVVGIQDMGAAGLTCAAFEMAERAGTGVRMYLDRVPQRETGMTPYEIMLSESQERMLLVAERGREQEILDIISRWELDGVIIGEVIEGTDVELMWEGELVSSMPVTVVTGSVPQYRWPEERPADYEQRQALDVEGLPEPADLGATWLELLGSPNLCSRRPVFEQYDSTIGSNTVVHPGGDAAVVRVKCDSGKEKGIAMTLDCNSYFCGVEPRLGAALGVAEALRNLAAVGAEPVGISDNLNFGSPERPDTMWQIAEGIRGISDAARAFGIPVVSGNVSLYNETKGKPILPTPLIAMVGLVPEATSSVGAHFVSDGDRVLVLGVTNPDELGASHYLAVTAGIKRGSPPLLDYDLEMKTSRLVRSLINDGTLRSAHDISAGGLAIALAECCFGTYSRIGARLSLSDTAGRKDGVLFSETGARYIVSCSPDQEARVREAAAAAGIPVTGEGTVGGSTVRIDGLAELDLDRAYEAWANGLKALFA